MFNPETAQWAVWRIKATLKNCMTLVNKMCDKGGRGIKKSKKLCDVIYEQSHGKYDSHNIVYHLDMS